MSLSEGGNAAHGKDPCADAPHISYKYAAGFWWSICWRTVLLSALISFILHIIAMAYYLLQMSHPPLKIVIAIFCAQVLLGIPLHIWVIQKMLEKRARNLKMTD